MRDVSALTREFDAKYDAYGAMVYRLAMVYLGCHADAEDVTQEAFMRLRTARRSSRTPGMRSAGCCA